MRAQLEALGSGAITFDQFARATSDNWMRLAKGLIARWEVPPGVDAADVQQELLTAAWCAIERYDPDRGVAFSRFLVFNAFDRATKWLHKQRGTRVTHAARTPITFAALGERGDWLEESIVDPSEPPDAELERTDSLASALADLECETQRIVLSLVIHTSGDVGEATRIILDDPKLRLVLHVTSEHQARKLIFRTLRKAARAA